MIQDIPLPEYYLESVDIDVSPQIGESVIGVVGTNLELKNPALESDPAGFRCDGTLLLQLFEKGQAPWEVDNFDESSKFGTAETKFVIYIPSTDSPLDDHVDKWIDGGEYSELDADFKTHLESGILQYIIDPIGTLLETSYSGIVPRVTFTPPSEDEFEAD